MGKKHNVISALQDQFKNVKDSSAFMKAMYADIYADKMDEMAAKMGSPIAKQKADMLKAQLHLQYAPQLAELAWRQGMLGSGAPVEQKVLALPKEDQKAATEELGKYNELEKLRSDMLKAHSELTSMTMNGALSPGKRDSMVNLYGGVLGKLAEGRYNEEAAKKQISSMLPDKLERGSTSEFKKKQIGDFFDTLNQPPPTLKKWGIIPPKAATSNIQHNKR